ncbi:BTB/POZ domain-containing adapter for CUL3-mediated RhoA degradation protein 2 [Ditylenchus destructor]|nr:BTB/POZ domain-containing adapter for CUL3-mediated RhoA degradation protein 2 [Ditylenchus destructor]
MSGNIPTPNSEWVRLNIGGKVFQTTKSTLSTHPDYVHFDTILNYFRNGVVNLDRNEKATKDLLCEANFYKVQPLVTEINKAMGTTPRPNGMVKRVEIVVVLNFNKTFYLNGVGRHCAITMSEKQDGYTVLQALRQKMELYSEMGMYFPPNPFEANWPSIEAVLRSYGFVEELNDPSLQKTSRKFVRSV